MNSTVKINFKEKTGKRIMPLHGVNSGPRTKSFVYDMRPQFVEAGLPYARLHDVEYPFGSGEYVDIPCVFKNFDADENDPANYNFALTDEYIRACLSCNTQVIYRLGISIEHAPVKRYTAPPKDFGKWARICEHIIRHYNEGWADGHHWNIEHWEIWNESDSESTKTWAGTQQQFIEFYTVAACHLKSCFPHLKIGGAAFTGSRVDNVDKFIEGISAKSPRVPLDFLSWHTYTDSTEKILRLAKHFREKLNECGYEDSESILDEWNYMGSWSMERQHTYYPMMKDHRGAAFYASVFCDLQRKTDVTLGAYFEADIVKEFCGIFNVKEMRININTPAIVEPTKGFYAFKAFNLLYRMGHEVGVTCDDDSLPVTAACGDGEYGVLVANAAETDRTVTLSLQGASGELVLRLTDEKHTFETLTTVHANGEETLTLCLPPHAFLYLGTDLPDPIPTYDPDCYKHISVAAPKDE